MNLRITFTLGLLAWMALGSAACSTPQLDSRSLYEQLGGEAGIDRLAERFLRELAADDEVSAHFKGIDARRFHTMLVEQICELSDGPCRYSGEPMLDVHRGMHITEREFNAVVEDLILAMEGLDLATPVQNRLLAKLAPMHDEIIESHVPRPDRGRAD